MIEAQAWFLVSFAVHSGRLSVIGILACSHFVKSCRQSRLAPVTSRRKIVKETCVGRQAKALNRVPKRGNLMVSGRSIREWHADSLGLAVEKAIKMLKKSIVAPSVAIALTGSLSAGVPRWL